MRVLWTDIRYALRALRQNPGFAVASLVALTLGIGGTTAIFSVLDAALLRPLPYPKPDRLMWVGITFPSLREEIMPGADYVEWSDQNRVFTGIAGLGGNTSCDVAGPGEPERITCGRVTANFFEVSGVRPVLGRGFLPAEGQPNGPGAIVLSHGLWQRRFGGDRGVLGKNMTVNGSACAVVGVMPPESAFPGSSKSRP